MSIHLRTPRNERLAFQQMRDTPSGEIPSWKRFSPPTPARSASTTEADIRSAPARTMHPIIRTLPALSGLLVLTMALTVLTGWALGITKSELYDGRAAR